ncbi:MAG: cytochrome C oxidase subunit IV family protein [Phycisphaerales bacterium]
MSLHDHDPDNTHIAPGDDPLTEGKVWEDPHHEHDHDHHHVIPFWPMFNTFIALLGLTVVTVWASGIPVSEFWHLFIALFIAVIKAALVCGYFMHLKYDKPLNSIVLLSSIFGVILFIGFSMLDLNARGWDDHRVRGEIHTGGRLELRAGSLPPFERGGDPRPKAPMNIVDLARQHAEQLHANEHAAEAHSEHQADDQAESHTGNDHSNDPAAPDQNNHSDPAPESDPPA